MSGSSFLRNAKLINPLEILLKIEPGLESFEQISEIAKNQLSYRRVYSSVGFKLFHFLVHKVHYLVTIFICIRVIIALSAFKRIEPQATLAALHQDSYLGGAARFLCSLIRKSGVPVQKHLLSIQIRTQITEFRNFRPEIVILMCTSVS